MEALSGLSREGVGPADLEFRQGTAMGTHESHVNYRNLIRDLAEMYPFDVEEVVVTELVANSLDAGATKIDISFDRRNKVLTVEDNGHGMSQPQFSAYHDFAAGQKLRGSGIGFAGLGAKISFNVAERVTTETVGREFRGGSHWYLSSDGRLIWEDCEPTNDVMGTRVSVQFRSSPSFADSNGLAEIMLRHYLPLFDPRFLEMYERLGVYASKLRFTIDGSDVMPAELEERYDLECPHLFFPKKRSGEPFGMGLFALSKVDYPMGRNTAGVMLATHGKVVKCEFLSQFPGAIGARLVGLVDISELIKFLTTSKTDFQIKGKHKLWHALIEPVRSEFKNWLGELGVWSPGTHSDDAARLERELKRLSLAVPELAEFFGLRAPAESLTPTTGGDLTGEASVTDEPEFPVEPGHGASAQPNAEAKPTTMDLSDSGTPGESVARRQRRGPKIAFVEQRDRVDVSWVDGSTIFVNEGHPAIRQVATSKNARMIAFRFAVSCAVREHLEVVSEAPDKSIVGRLLAAWAGQQPQ